MPTSPGWYVAVCSVPELVFDLGVALLIVVSVDWAASAIGALGRITRITTICLFGYGLWHFGIFTGVGIIAISFLCTFLIHRCIWKCLDPVVARRFADFRQRAIHAILNAAGVTKIGTMAEIVEELETYDDEMLQGLTEEVFESECPEQALFAGIIERRMEDLEDDLDDDSVILLKSDLRYPSDIQKWLRLNVQILAEDDREVSRQMQPDSSKRAKTRRRRKAKSRAAAKPTRPPGNRQ